MSDFDEWVNSGCQKAWSEGHKSCAKLAWEHQQYRIEALEADRDSAYSKGYYEGYDVGYDEGGA